MKFKESWRNPNPPITHFFFGFFSHILLYHSLHGLRHKTILLTSLPLCLKRYFTSVFLSVNNILEFTEILYFNIHWKHGLHICLFSFNLFCSHCFYLLVSTKRSGKQAWEENTVTEAKSQVYFQDLLSNYVWKIHVFAWNTCASNINQQLQLGYLW